ncbi:MAG: sulfotransferase [Sulfitobacter sp.]|nr:sulfotransferase [Sulfitobacter sp.]
MRERRALPPRHVFVGGLHRSGTSLVAGLIAAHPEVTALHAPDVPEGEGVFVQGAIPHTAQHGIPGAFAFDPAQHMTEDHPLNRLETRMRLDRDWGPRFEQDKPWRLEKSPVNILRTRLYQQLFPMAHFVMVLRHPVAVARAMAKWSDAPLAELLRHWERAHSLLLADLPYLHAVHLVRYEDLVASPTLVRDRIFHFLALEPAGVRETPQVFDGNSRYDLAIDLPLPEIAARLGYALPASKLGLMPEEIICRHPLSAIRREVTARLEPSQAPIGSPGTRAKGALASD